MTDTDAIRALIADLEKAEAGSRELDVSIWNIADWPAKYAAGIDGHL